MTTVLDNVIDGKFVVGPHDEILDVKNAYEVYKMIKEKICFISVFFECNVIYKKAKL